MRALEVPRIDDQTFTALLHRAMPGVRRFLRRLCGSDADADDLLQETLAKVWRLRATFDPRRGGGPWLLQAAFRCFCDHRRRLRAFPDSGPANAVPTLVEPTRAIEARDELQHRLRALSPLARDLLLGFHAEGHSLQELAARHALPLNTVKSHLHRARQQLHEGRR